MFHIVICDNDYPFMDYIKAIILKCGLQREEMIDEMGDVVCKMRRGANGVQIAVEHYKDVMLLEFVLIGRFY